MNIYELLDPRNGKTRYVGCTKSSINHRLIYHMRDAKDRGPTRPLLIWIRELQTLGLRPQAALLEGTDDKLRERFWIRFYMDMGADLLNSTNGAEQLPGCVALRNFSGPSRVAKLGRPLSAKHREALLRANTGRRMNEKTRAALAAYNATRRMKKVKGV